MSEDVRFEYLEPVQNNSEHLMTANWWRVGPEDETLLYQATVGPYGMGHMTHPERIILQPSERIEIRTEVHYPPPLTWRTKLRERIKELWRRK